MSAATAARPSPPAAVPFEGRMSYCLTKSLKMLLDHQGECFPLPFLECVGTEVFGFIYVPPVGVAVTGHPYHVAGERMLKRLGFEFANPSFDAPGPALDALGEALEHGPVALGMLDMGYLTYDPDHERKRGADHAVVALELRKEAIVVHDPDGYVAVPLLLDDFVKAWKAEGLYPRKSYMMWRIGARQRRPDDDEIYRGALVEGLGNLRMQPDPSHGPALFGPPGLRGLADDLRSGRATRFLPLYSHWSFRVSGQRCLDAAAFIRAAPFVTPALDRAAVIRLAQAWSFGEAQAAAARGDLPRVAAALDRLAEREHEFTEALADGLEQTTA